MVVKDDGLEVSSKIILGKKKKRLSNAFKLTLKHLCHSSTVQASITQTAVINEISKIIPSIHEAGLMLTHAHV